MGELLNVTDRTVKNDIKNLREELQIFSNYLKIESKPSLGYALIIDDIEIKNELKKYYRIYQPQIVDTELDRRVNFIIRHLLSLNEDEYLKLEMIYDELYLSVHSNLKKGLTKVKEYLSLYGLNLTMKPYYGMKIEGSEIAKSMMTIRMYKYFDKQAKIDFHIPSYNKLFHISSDEYTKIKHVLYQNIRESNVVFSDIYAERLLIYVIYFSNLKCKARKENLKNEINNLNVSLFVEKTEEYKFVTKFNENLKITYPKYVMDEYFEKFLTMVAIMSIDLYRYIDCNVSRYGKLISITDEIIVTIDNYFKEKLHLSVYNDPTCYKDLTKLMIPISLKVFLNISDDVDLGFYNMDVQSNKPLLYYYIEDMADVFFDIHSYRFSTREKYLIYNVIKGMFDRMEMPTRPLKIALIAINGRLSTQNIKFNLKHHFSHLIDRIDTRMLYDLEMEDPENLDYDYYLCMDYGKNMSIPFRPIYYADEEMSESEYYENLSTIFHASYDYDVHLPEIKIKNISSKSRFQPIIAESIKKDMHYKDHFVLDKDNKIHLYISVSHEDYFDIYTFENPDNFSLEGVQYIIDIGVNLSNNQFKIKMIFSIIDAIIMGKANLREIVEKQRVCYRDFVGI
jgi:lichenan operon transcriptional antiterminator